MASGGAFQAGVLTSVSRALQGPLPSPWEPVRNCGHDELAGLQCFSGPQPGPDAQCRWSAPTVGPTRPQGCSAVVSTIGTQFLGREPCSPFPVCQASWSVTGPRAPLTQLPSLVHFTGRKPGAAGMGDPQRSGTRGLDTCSGAQGSSRGLSCESFPFASSRRGAVPARVRLPSRTPCRWLCTPWPRGRTVRAAGSLAALSGLHRWQVA